MDWDLNLPAEHHAPGPTCIFSLSSFMSAERVMVFERSCISTSLVWLSRMELSCTCSQPADEMREEAGQQTLMPGREQHEAKNSVGRVAIACVTSVALHM